tara:strand:+ start:403 stop:702 length:300 start_codon:yes stop_codon:yes gene_type:complete
MMARYILDRNSLSILKIENRGSFGIDQVFYPKPKCQEQIEREAKAQGYECKINKGGPNHPDPNSQALRNTPANLKTAFLKIVEKGIEKVHASKLGKETK